MTQSQSIVDILTKEGVCAARVDPAGLEGMSATKGAYVLLIETASPLSIRLPRNDVRVLVPGTYLYVGSANGPGGIKARLGRHFRRNKKIHWHVDQLTTRAKTIEALAVEGGDECALGELLLASGCYQVALAGFGSSDCRTCSSHLLQPVKKGQSV